MNREKCDEYMDRFLELDKGERIPFDLTWHLFTCSECRKEVRSLTKAEKAAAKPLNTRVSVNDPVISAVMKKIESRQSRNVRVPIVQWIVAGVIMIAAIFLFAVFTTHSPYNSYMATFYLVAAGAITAYCMLFVGTNIDFFIKKTNAHK